MKYTLLAFAALLLIAASSDARSMRASSRSQCAFSNSKCFGHDWTKLSRSQPTDIHSVTFAVKMQGDAAATCDSLLMKISSPESSQYGMHMSLDEVNQIFSSSENIRKVESFLESRGFSYKTSGDFVTVKATISRLESLLNAQFYNFRSARANKVITRTASYVIPSEIEDVVEFATNTINFPAVKATIRMHVDQVPANTVAPSVINKVYKIASNQVTSKNATQSVFEALGQNYAPADLAQFQSQWGLANNPVSKVIGNNDPTQCAINSQNCMEADLDVEYIMAVAQGAKTTFWVITDESQDPFYDWIVALSQMSNPPLVHSISYGSIATEDPQTDMARFATETCKLGLRGVTVVVSSGDDGVANFEARDDPSQCGFNPSFPATVPYVTAVGATQGPESGNPEIACSSSTGGIITSGGGFSIFFPQPAYQAQAVATYMSNAPQLPPSNMYNGKGRGYPDVALMGASYNTIVAGQNILLYGTSASAPVFAGMVTLVNDARQNSGKSSVGFLNPTLYHLAATKTNIFNDVTVGENNCCAGQPGSYICCQYGFNATKGWDPITGLGSVNFAAFRAAFLNSK